MDPKAAAEMMLERLTESGYLYQEQIAHELWQSFGDEAVYLNQNGNHAIAKSILAEFRKLTEGKVVWDRGGRYWRWKDENDGPGRQGY